MNDPAAETTPADGPVAGAVQESRRRVRNAFRMYRAMAFITGVMLLVLTFEMVAKYVFNDSVAVLGSWVAIVHGWIYVIYLVTVFNLWSLMRWRLGRLVGLVIAGVVPVLSFVLELRAKGWVEADLPEVVERARQRAELLNRQ